MANYLTLAADTLTLDNGNRKMQGVAYSGEALLYDGDYIVIDLASLKLDTAKQIPLLLNHDTTKVVGYGYLSVDNGQLLIKGEMLDNPEAAQVISAADKGLQWQLSIGFQSNTILGAPEGSVINGRTLSYDCYCFHNALVRETSFTPTGADANTSAVILSLGGNNAMKIKQNDKPELNAEGTKETVKAAETNLTAEGLTATLSLLQERLNEANNRITQLTAHNAELESVIKHKEKEVKLSALVNLGVKQEKAEVLADIDNEDAFKALVEVLELNAKQSALLNASYATETAEDSKKENPILKFI